MKTFYQLTAEQQENAIKFAEDVIRNTKSGLYENPIEEKSVHKIATMAAEGSMYDEDGNAIIGKSDYWSLGGCV